jgi:hypothetical protein
MNAPTTHNTINADEAQFLAPETHQRAAVETEFSSILQEALTRPGVVNEAYRAFHNYSIGNQILAAMQLAAKGLPLSPIASFNAWKEKGRFVQKGQKAISLFMPVSVKRRDKKGAAAETAESGDDKGGTFNVFMLRANWFSLAQTEGADFEPELIVPAWDAKAALAALDVTEVPFEQLRGNVLGYAQGRSIAISPLNALKLKTRFHELAHVVLGHTAESDMIDTDVTPRDIREAEAEGVAYILCTLLDLPGQAESRGYIQGWLDGRELPEKSAKRIFGAADKIMKAGQPVKH